MPGIAIGSYIKFAKYNSADIVWCVINLDPQVNPLLWLNTPRTGYPGAVRVVFADGSVQSHGAFNSTVGVRPAIYLDLQNITLTSGSGSVNDPYVYSSTLKVPTDIALSNQSVAEN